MDTGSSFWGDENVLESELMVVQHCEFTNAIDFTLYKFHANLKEVNRASGNCRITARVGAGGKWQNMRFQKVLDMAQEAHLWPRVKESL